MRLDDGPPGYFASSPAPSVAPPIPPSFPPMPATFIRPCDGRTRIPTGQRCSQMSDLAFDEVRKKGTAEFRAMKNAFHPEYCLISDEENEPDSDDTVLEAGLVEG